MWRLGALLLSVLIKIPVTHGSLLIGYPASHWLFAIYCYYWIAAELAGYTPSQVGKWMNKAGKYSFSLYLVHVPVMLFLRTHADWAANLQGRARLWGFAVQWLLMLAVLAAVTYGFYRLIERPFHGLARRFGAKRVPDSACVPM